MATLRLVVILFLLVFFVYKSFKECNKEKNANGFLFICYIIGALLSAFVAVLLIIDWYDLCLKVATSYIIDEKIEMLEEENAEIEENIDLIVKNYMNYESNTYERFKDEDAINLVSLFPELKSDTLVTQQIDVYVANKQEIKTLKTELIDLSKARFELYFGR